MVTAVAAFGSLSLMSAPGVAAAVAAAAADGRSPARPTTAQPAACIVALAPVTMTALLDAQAHVDLCSAPIVRVETLQKLDRLISSLAGAPATAPANDDAPLTVRDLEDVREALARTPVDLQA